MMVRSQKIRAAENPDMGFSFEFEWSIGLGISNVFSIALIREEGGYGIVSTNGTHISSFHCSEMTTNTYDVLSNLRGVLGDVDSFGMSFLSSNITDAYGVGVAIKKKTTFGRYDMYGVLVKADWRGVYVLIEAAPLSSGIGNVVPVLRGDSVWRKGNVCPQLNMYPGIVGNLKNMSVFYHLWLSEKSWRNAIACANISSGIYGIDVGYGMSSPFSVAMVDVSEDNSDELIGPMNVSNNIYVVVETLGYDPVCGHIDSSVFNVSSIAGPSPISGQMVDIVVGDIDVDGFPEVLVDSSLGGGCIHVFNMTNPLSSLLEEERVYVGRPIDRLLGLNFDGTDSMELAFVDPMEKKLYVIDLNGHTVFSSSLDGEALYDIVPAELDGDGYADMVLLTDTYAWFFASGGISGRAQLPCVPTSNIILADVDMDGVLEWLYASNGTLICNSVVPGVLGNRQFSNPRNTRVFEISGDTDGDGICDYDEVYKYTTSPYIPNEVGDSQNSSDVESSKNETETDTGEEQGSEQHDNGSSIENGTPHPTEDLGEIDWALGHNIVSRTPMLRLNISIPMARMIVREALSKIVIIIILVVIAAEARNERAEEHYRRFMRPRNTNISGRWWRALRKLLGKA